MQQQTISQLDCDMWLKVDCIWQPAMTSSVARPRRSTSQSQTCTKKRTWSLFWWSTARLIHYSFTYPTETITSLRSMLSKLMRRTENCIWHWSTERASIKKRQINRNSSRQQHPTACCTTNASKVEQIGLWNFASSAIFTIFNRLPCLQASKQLFAGRMLPQPARGRKCFSRVC